MSDLSRTLTYAATQTARVAFYGAHYLVARMVARDAFTEMPVPEHPIPSLTTTLAAMRALFAKDWANVEAGIYPAPIDPVGEMRAAMKSTRYLMDIPRVARRRRRHGHSEVKDADDLPRYFRQNFHFQTGGYLSRDSAKLYDFQVEALFAGTADAMRRQAFVPIAKYLEGRKLAQTTLLDIGAGTGRFLSFVKRARPDLKAIALDLSEPYLEEARRNLARHKHIEFVHGAAEKMPLPDCSVDAAVSIFLFHELPPKIRAAAAKEIARLLKPGGIFVLADSIQYGDTPEFDGMIDAFPHLLHEPYFTSYAKTDFTKLFGEAGLKGEGSEIAYLTKISVFRKLTPSARGGAARGRPKRKPASLRLRAQRGCPRKDRDGPWWRSWCSHLSRQSFFAGSRWKTSASPQSAPRWAGRWKSLPESRPPDWTETSACRPRPCASHPHSLHRKVRRPSCPRQSPRLSPR